MKAWLLAHNKGDPIKSITNTTSHLINWQKKKTNKQKNERKKERNLTTQTVSKILENKGPFLCCCWVYIMPEPQVLWRGVGQYVAKI